jgi:hypothetical protein
MPVRRPAFFLQAIWRVRYRPPPGHKTDSYDIYISSLGVGEGYMVNVGSKAVYCLTIP